MGVQTPGGQRNTNTNAGAGAGIAKPKVGPNTPLKSLVAGTDITINETADEIEIVSTASDADENVKVSANDTTAGKLIDKVVAGTNVTVTELNDGGNETLEISATGAVDSVFGRTGAVVAATSDYDAIQVDNTPAGSISATNVQAALNGLDTTKAALAGATITTASVNGVTLSTAGSSSNSLREDGTYIAVSTGAVDSVHGRTGVVVSANGDYTASEVTNVPAGSIVATDAQAAITELDTEKAPNSGATMTTASVNGVTLTAAGAATNFLTEAGTYIVPAGSGDGHVIEDDGTPVTQRASLNFIGATLTDNAGADSTDVTIPGIPLFTTFTPSTTWDAAITWNAAVWKDLGDEIKVVMRGTFTGAAPAGIFDITLPASKAIDTTIINNAEIRTTKLGHGFMRDDTGSASYIVHMCNINASTTALRVCSETASASHLTSGNVTNSSPFVVASGDFFWIEFTVPVA